MGVPGPCVHNDQEAYIAVVKEGLVVVDLVRLKSQLVDQIEDSVLGGTDESSPEVDPAVLRVLGAEGATPNPVLGLQDQDIDTGFLQGLTSRQA